jgi:quercetin dioxygenase-like cupin family protein
MRRGFFALGSLAAVALATPAWAGDVTVIETSEGSRPIAVKKDVSALAAVPKMADGKENQGFSYGGLYELPGAGIRVMRGHIDPKGFVAVHQGAGQYILYVVAGTGKLTLNGKGGEQIGEVIYKPDDIIVFQPNTLHGWINGDAAFEFLGFDMPVLRK